MSVDNFAIIILNEAIQHIKMCSTYDDKTSCRKGSVNMQLSFVMTHETNQLQLSVQRS
jgi:hypothetical protein